MKLCPNCDSDDIGCRWCNGRKLQSYCNDCDWKGEPEIPESKEIETEKLILTGQFSGFYYTVFDKYGYVVTYSRYYALEELARIELNKELEKGRRNKEYGPYTAVLWPATVKVKGEIIK